MTKVVAQADDRIVVVLELVPAYVTWDRNDGDAEARAISGIHSSTAVVVWTVHPLIMQLARYESSLKFDEWMTARMTHTCDKYRRLPEQMVEFLNQAARLALVHACTCPVYLLYRSATLTLQQLLVLPRSYMQTSSSQLSRLLATHQKRGPYSA